MRILAIVTLALAMLLPRPCAAQTTEWPDYTPEQRWNRMAQMGVLGVVSAIAYAKAQNADIEEFGKWWGDLFAPSWGQPGTSGPFEVMRGMRRNFLINPAAEFEILAQTENSVSARFNRPYVTYFGESGTWYGVTLEEYERLNSMFFQRIAEYHGLAFDERREGERWVITFSRR